MKKIDNKIKISVSIQRQMAFTLAEVLIVLGIIGVVAALTIPTLMTKTQNQEYITALKKAYTETNQALKLLANDNGCAGDLKCTGFFAKGLADPDNTFGDELVKYFHVAKNCKTDINQGCLPTSTNTNFDGTGTTYNKDTNTHYKFVTSDGMSFIINNYANNCITDGTEGSSNYSTGKTGNMSQTCGDILIDINGLKKPNRYGRDTFFFFITNGKGPLIYPDGGSDFINPWIDNSGTPTTCIPTNPKSQFCAGRVMEEGWQMNY